ncbi:MAG: N-acetyltransferase [Candidatus Sericytochromatia bacterium]
MNILIRKENINDFIGISEVNTQAFKQENEAKLVNLLRSSINFIPELSLVAILNDKLIGHILFTKIKIINEKKQGFESLALAPMSVLPEFQNKGIGSKLVKEGLNQSKNLGYKSVIVLGHSEYYPKFGFKKASNWNIKCPFNVPDSSYMAIELIDKGLDNISGIVEYSKEFSLL